MACMTRPFVKMNGAGNDFVVVNALEQPFAPGEDQILSLGAGALAGGLGLDGAFLDLVAGARRLVGVGAAGGEEGQGG